MRKRKKIICQHKSDKILIRMKPREILVCIDKSQFFSLILRYKFTQYLFCDNTIFR